MDGQVDLDIMDQHEDSDDATAMEEGEKVTQSACKIEKGLSKDEWSICSCMGAAIYKQL